MNVNHSIRFTKNIFFLFIFFTTCLLIITVVSFNYNKAGNLKSKAFETLSSENEKTIPISRMTSPTIPPVTVIPTISEKAKWLDNDRKSLKNSFWFNYHAYQDCAKDSGGFWPEGKLDCLFPDQLSGPSVADKELTDEPENLYYKHMIPSDFMKHLSDEEKIAVLKEGIGLTLKTKITVNLIKYSTVSVDSLIVGLESGKDGNIIRSVSLIVYPQLESLFTAVLRTEMRSKILYQPFIEEAIGQKVEANDVHELYLAALNRCGENAENGDQSGLGVYKDFGEYKAVVQFWGEGGDSTKDCNIHVVKKS